MHYVKRRKDELLILKSDTPNVEEFPGNVNSSKLLISYSIMLIDIFAQCGLLILPYICHFAKCEARYFLRLQLSPTGKMLRFIVVQRTISRLCFGIDVANNCKSVCRNTMETNNSGNLLA